MVEEDPRVTSCTIPDQSLARKRDHRQRMKCLTHANGDFNPNVTLVRDRKESWPFLFAKTVMEDKRKGLVSEPGSECE